MEKSEGKCNHFQFDAIRMRWKIYILLRQPTGIQRKICYFMENVNQKLLTGLVGEARQWELSWDGRAKADTDDKLKKIIHFDAFCMFSEYILFFYDFT